MKFGIVGILNTAIDVSLFFLLVSIGLPYWIAQSISYSGGMMNSYLVNRHYTFEEKKKKSRAEFLRFVLVNLVTLLLATLLIKVTYQFGQWSLVTSKATATAVGLLLNYELTNRWVFRHTNQEVVHHEN